MNNKITIILCAYNAQGLIESAIKNILAQKDYEYYVDQFLLVDNNSTDGTAKIIKKYEKRFYNIKYLFEPKQGLGYARMKGVLNTKTKWIAFIDDDNRLEKNWIEEAINFIEKNPDIGAFNGAVIPEIRENLNEKEKIHLKIAYKALACTHLERKDIKNGFDRSNFGAGLVIRSKELKELACQGGLKNTGRCGKKLSSGEDTEMINYIISKGYKTTFNEKMIISHIISPARLNIKYLKKIYKSFEKNSFERSDKKTIFLIKKYIIQIIAFFFLIINYVKKNNYEEKIKLKLQKITKNEIKKILSHPLLYKIWFSLKLKKINNYIIIYQMGKVGSTSIYKSLLKYGIPALHLHRANPQNIKNVKNARIKRGLDSSYNKKVDIEGLTIYNKILRNKKNNIKVITLIREPISRNISDFFEMYRDYFASLEEFTSTSNNKIVDIFLKKFQPDNNPESYFVDEIQTTLGIDVFQGEFEQKKGWQIYHGNNVDLLLIKSEIEDDKKEKIIKEFLGIEKFKITRENTGQNKFKNKYQKFKNEIKIPPEYLNKYLGSKYAKHFYTTDELEKVRKKYKKNNI